MFCCFTCYLFCYYLELSIETNLVLFVGLQLSSCKKNFSGSSTHSLLLLIDSNVVDIVPFLKIMEPTSSSCKTFTPIIFHFESECILISSKMLFCVIFVLITLSSLIFRDLIKIRIKFKCANIFLIFLHYDPYY